jgi:hypothetical protein
MNTPWAPAPRACTTRSGMRSWSKCVTFSRRWWSCSSVGPRAPALREWSVSRMRSPCDVVRKGPCGPTSVALAPVAAPVAVRRSGAAWSALGGSGPRGLVGSSSDGGSGAGTPGIGGGTRSATASSAFWVAFSTVLFMTRFTALADVLGSMGVLPGVWTSCVPARPRPEPHARGSPAVGADTGTNLRPGMEEPPGSRVPGGSWQTLASLVARVAVLL